MNALTESPPGGINGKSAPEKTDSKFAADNDAANVNYYHSTNQSEVNGSKELPPILTMRQSYANPAKERPEIIKGVLRQECKMTLSPSTTVRVIKLELKLVIVAVVQVP